MLSAGRRVLLAAALAACVAALAGRAMLAQTPAGGTEITRDSDGQTLHVPQGGDITVRMGSDLDWTVSVDPPGLLQPAPGAGTLQRGVQALLRAVQPGSATLTAEGKPHCDPGQSCAQFIVSVIVTIVVDPGSAAPQPPSATLPAPNGGATAAPAATALPGSALPHTGAGGGAARTGFGAIFAIAALLAGAALLLTAVWRLRRAGETD